MKDSKSVFTWKLILDPPFGSTICLYFWCMVSGIFFCGEAGEGGLSEYGGSDDIAGIMISWYRMWCHAMISGMWCHVMISSMWCHAMISGMWCHAMISRVDVMTWYRVCDVMPCYRVYWRVQFHDIYKLNSISCDIICRCSSCHAMISYAMSCHVMISSIHEPRVVLSISNNNVIAYNA